MSEATPKPAEWKAMVLRWGTAGGGAVVAYELIHKLGSDQLFSLLQAWGQGFVLSGAMLFIGRDVMRQYQEGHREGLVIARETAAASQRVADGQERLSGAVQSWANQNHVLLKDREMLIDELGERSQLLLDGQRQIKEEMSKLVAEIGKLKSGV